MGWSNRDNFNNGLFYLTERKLWTNKLVADFWGDNRSNIGNAASGIKPFKEDGTAHVEAYVKEGRFHILYNGTELVNRSMEELFPEGHGNYNAETSQISIGIGGLQTNQNQARFSNTTFLSGDDIVKTDSKAVKQEQTKKVVSSCAEVIKSAFSQIREQ